MVKLPTRARHGNGQPQPLPLFEFAERQRWDNAPPAARMVRRRFGIASAATARAVAELAGFPVGDGR